MISQTTSGLNLKMKAQKQYLVTFPCVCFLFSYKSLTAFERFITSIQLNQGQNFGNVDPHP